VSALILLRHGQSEWNAEGRFAGWVDVALTPAGRAEARRSAELLAAASIRPDIAYTSELQRAVETTDIVLGALGISPPVHRSWRLNERHYGALQGKRKGEVRAEFGVDLFTSWRRSYEASPPPLVPDPLDTGGASSPSATPTSESLAQVGERLLPWWRSAIAPSVAAGLDVLVVAHSNSLRALVKHLDAIADDAIAGVNIPTGIPLIYPVDAGRPVGDSYYLDASAAADAIDAVAREGLGDGSAAELGG
jgi:2,3-bisphosphoglycerate-dependent phosphoglycerate mutase